MLLNCLVDSVISSSSDTSSLEASNGFGSSIYSTSYSNFEIIFWYSAFVLIVIIFIVFIKTQSKKTKKIDYLINKTEREINRYSTIIKELSLKKNTIKSKDLFVKTPFVISSIELYIIELKEKTQLSNCDLVLSITAKISKKIKSSSNIRDDNEEQLKRVKNLQDELIKLKGQLELIKQFVK